MEKGGNMNAFECLKDWAQLYVKHRDIAYRKIACLRDSAKGFIVENSDGSFVECFVLPSLTLDLKDIVNSDGKSCILFTLSNKKNIQLVSKSWDGLARNRNLVVVFASPFSTMEDKWVIRPYLHNLMCDRSSLLQGLNSLSEFIEPVDEESLPLKAQKEPIKE
jgi:hypothetical protein